MTWDNFIGYIRPAPGNDWFQLCSHADFESCWHLLELQASHFNEPDSVSLAVMPKSVLPMTKVPR